MHRAALLVPIRQAAVSQKRCFVSTVLLTKAWENETVNELRKEARKRGLPCKGSKATLVIRLQQDDQKKTFTPPPASIAPQARRASTSTVFEPETEVPGVPFNAEPIHPQYNLDVKVPDVSESEPEIPVQIPFVPDLWESSKLKHESVPEEPEFSTEPKVVVVGGDANIQGGGPSTNVYSPTASTSSGTVSEPEPWVEPTSNLAKLAADMADDIGLPKSFKLPQSADVQYDIAAKTETLGGQSKSYSRTLDSDEKSGLWVLLGAFVGSWIAASYFAPTSEWAKKTEETVENVEEKTDHKKD